MMNIDLRANYPLRELTTFDVGGPARYFLIASGEEDVVRALGFAKERKVPIFVLGGGSNVLISDEGFPGLVILNRIKGFRNRQDGNYMLVYAGAGEDWQHFADRCVSEDWQGVECLAGIPGTVGAAPVQNIGAYGQDASQTIAGVRAIESDTGSSVYFNAEECGFGYRKSIFNSSAAGRYVITGVTFRLKPGGEPSILYRDLERQFEGGKDVTLDRVRNAVINIRSMKGLLVREGHEIFRSGGSFFKNPIVTAERFGEIERLVEKAGGCSNWAWPMDSGDMKMSAACLIQSSGFKPGYRNGNVGLSPKHALILINYGGATAEDIIGFAGDLQKRVFENFGVVLRPEVRLVGFPPDCLAT